MWKINANVKNDRSAKCEKMSTLNVKSARSAKCENNSTLNVKKSFSQLDDQPDGQLGQFSRPGKFFRHFGVAGRIMIFTENVNFRPGSWYSFFLNCLVKKKPREYIGGGGLEGSTLKKYVI